MQSTSVDASGARPRLETGAPMGCVGVTTLLIGMLAGCGHPPTQVNATPVTAAEPEPKPKEPRVADLCMRGHRVYVLLDDGRIRSASVKAERFGPSITGMTATVELSCGRPAVCARDEQGTVRCIDDQDQVRPLEGLGPAIALAGDCAITGAGELYCWYDELVAERERLPTTSAKFGAMELNQLHRVVFAPDGGCAVQTSGRLWCWARGDTYYPIDLGEPKSINEHTEERTYAPHVIAEFINPTEIDELSLSTYNGACWQIRGEWTCINEHGEQFAKPPTCDTLDCDCSFPCPDSECGSRACECRSERVGMRCAHAGEIELDDRWSVRGMVLRDDECLLDRDGRVWCQSSGFDADAPHEVRLAAAP